jgi:hypothetical protein
MTRKVKKLKRLIGRSVIGDQHSGAGGVSVHSLGRSPLQGIGAKRPLWIGRTSRPTSQGQWTKSCWPGTNIGPPKTAWRRGVESRYAGSVLKFPLDACASSPPGPPALVRERQAVVAHHPVEQPRAPALATALLNLSKHYAAAGRHADATAAHAQSDAIRKKLFGPHGAGDGSFPIFSWSRQKSAMAAANVVKVVSGRSA